MLKIIPQPHGIWYVGFQHNGFTKILPTRRRFFRKWATYNCPLYSASKLDVNRHLHFLNKIDGGRLTMENLREVFYARYRTLESYLELINSGQKIVMITHSDALWELRNLRGRCGKCGCNFSNNNPDFGGGQCRNCWSQREC